MPVLVHDTDFLIWEVTETLPELLSVIPASVTRPDYRAESRMLEWAAVQMALKSFTGVFHEVLHYENGAPYLAQDNRCLSISHTRGAVAIYFSSCRCGIDVEYLAGRADKLRTRFMSEQEGFLKHDDRQVEATLLWSAKEAVFKVLEDQEAIDFKNHLHAEAFPYALTGTFKMQETKTPYQQWYEVSYHIFDSFVFTKAIPLD